MFAYLPAAFSLLGDYTEDYAWFPEAASTFAADNDWLYGFITWVCVLFFIPIAGSLFYFAYKYHKPKGAKAESNVAHNTPIELAWSVGPSFFLVGMFVLGAKSYLDHRTVPDGANEIGVKAMKWSWIMDYGGGTFHPELHILVNEPAKMSMRSADVIHALSVPAFRAKKDIVPGRYNYMWFKPTVASKIATPEILAEAKAWHESEDGKKWAKESGTAWNYDKMYKTSDGSEIQITPDGYTFYDLFCAEYCGKDHSQMQTVVVVHKTLDDLNAWIKEYSKRGDDVTPAAYGELLYARRGCSGCHSVDGTKRVGPSFKETFGNDRKFVSGETTKADENYINESVVYPKAKVVAGYQPVMPSYKGQLTLDDVDSIIAYLKTVSDHTPKGTKTEEAAEPAETSEPAE